MKSALIFLIFTMVAAISFASSAGSHEEAGIPFEKIGIQALNLGILLAALIYFVRTSIIDFFSQRQGAFNEQSKKTERALKQAELELKDIKEKLAQLESTESASISRANVEAQNTKEKILLEAAAQAEKMKADVALVIHAEVYKAKNLIRNEIIEKSISTARENIRSSSQTITQKSEKGFVSDLGQVKA